MSVFLNSLTLTNGSLIPAFNPNIYEYNFYLEGSNDTTVITATTENNVEPIQIEYFENNEIIAGPGPGPITTPEIVIQGLQNIRVIVSYSGSQTIYRVKVSLSKGKWPIHNDLLNPGMYGGSYVPNYRMLKEIYTIGSGDKDFEGDYDLKAPLNEQALDFLNNTINQFTSAGKLDAIVESFIHYSGFVNTNWPDDGDYRYYLPLIEVGVDRPTTLKNGFIPKNNKLFSYPYSALKIIGYGGESELKYELFPEDVHFGIVSKFFAGTSIQLYPINYEGILDAYSAGVAGQPLPIFPYTKDDYLNEYNASLNTRSQSALAMEQNKNMAYLSTGVSAMGQSFQSIGLGRGMDSAGMVVGGLISTVGGGIVQNKQADLQYNQGMAAMAATLKDTEARPSSIANQNASPSIPNVMKDAVVPFVQRVSIRENFAKKVDDFFSRYGYRVNKIGIPNIKSRPAYNFLRCSDAHIDGNIPNEDLLEIKSVLEHGVTFWHNKDVGNYNLENTAPITNNPQYSQPIE